MSAPTLSRARQGWLGLLLVTGGILTILDEGPAMFPRSLLTLYPLVVAVGVLAGLRTALVAALLSFLVVLTTVPLNLPLDLIVAATLVAVGAMSGTLADRLARAHKEREEIRLASNSFAAALHHRLTLAEQEIERIHTGHRDAPEQRQQGGALSPVKTEPYPLP